jgi:pectate lyase
MQPKHSWLFLIPAFVAGALSSFGAAGDAPPRSEPYLQAARAFADTVLERGRDTYGPRRTPLFAEGLHAETLEPVRWKRRGDVWVLSNFASQQALMRLLDGLSALTGEPRYRAAAEEAARYALRHLQTPNGLLSWGGHMAWDLEQERPVGQYTNIHEMKMHQPHFPLLWRADAAATRRLLEAIWGAHVLDWALLDYNRHARTDLPSPPQWQHPFREDVEVPFPTEARNLSFALSTPSLIAAGTALAVLGNDTNALLWTRRLARRWQQARDPKTGLSGGQLSYRKEDRARDALGHVHPTINEAKIIATYHRTGRYHDIPIAQMQAAEQLRVAGNKFKSVGDEFIRWASDDLKTYARHCYDRASGQFIALMTDGTPIRWQDAREGYYSPSSFAPAGPDALIFWNYALAFRLTRDPAHWDMAREIGKVLGLGDLGPKPRSRQRELDFETRAADWRFIYGLLELHRATGDRRFLTLAARVGDNLRRWQTQTHLFPRPGYAWGRTGDAVPLALLHLAAALDGRSDRLPQPMLDNGYLHCEHDGASGPNPNIQDDRTYDSTIYFGGY